MKILPLTLDYLIPDYVQDELNELINYINTSNDENLLSLDCYECEVYSAINSALQSNKINQSTADELIYYYVHRGWMTDMELIERCERTIEEARKTLEKSRRVGETNTSKVSTEDDNAVFEEKMREFKETIKKFDEIFDKEI